MSDSERYASTHECLVELLRRMPRRALVELICRARGIVLGEIAEITERIPTIEVPGLLRRARKGTADFVLIVHTKDGRIILIVIAEAQLSWDAGKIWDWAMLPTAFAAEARRTAILAVFCPKPELRTRYRRALRNTLPPPTLIEPNHVEIIVDPDQALSRPHETILGAIYHARIQTDESTALAITRAALLAAQSLEPTECLRYCLLMQSQLPTELFKQAAAQIDPRRIDPIEDSDRDGALYHEAREVTFEIGLDESMIPIVHHVFKRGLIRGILQRLEEAKRRREQMLAESREEGEIRALRRLLLDMLEWRGFTLTPSASARIDSCKDAKTLECWYIRARTWDPNSPLADLLA